MGYEDLLIARTGQKRTSSSYKLSGALFIVYLLISAAYEFSIWKLWQDLLLLVNNTGIAFPVILRIPTKDVNGLNALIYVLFAIPVLGVVPFVILISFIRSLQKRHWNVLLLFHLFSLLLHAFVVYSVIQTYQMQLQNGGGCFNIVDPVNQQVACTNLFKTYIAGLVFISIDIFLILCKIPVSLIAKRDVSERILMETEKRNLGFAS